MVIVSTTEAEFDKQYTAAYDLCILLEKSQVYYAIISRSNLVLQLEQYQYTSTANKVPTFNQLMAFLYEEVSILRKPFRTITVGLETERFSLVPEKLYDESSSEVYFHLLCDSLSAGTRLCVDTPSEQFKLLYPVSDSLRESLFRQFPAARQKHYLTALVGLYNSHALLVNGQKVYLHFSENKIAISYYANTKLTFCNHYGYKTAMDCLYFTLLVYRQFKLKTEDVPIFITGQITEDSRIYGLLYRYIRKLVFIDEETDTKLLPTLRSDNAYLYAELLSLHFTDS